MANDTEWWKSGVYAMKKLLKYVITVMSASMVLGAVAGQAGAASLSYGNNSENILNGGVLATDGTRTYFANMSDGQALYAGSEKSRKKLSSDAAENINVLGKYVYYTTSNGSGSSIVRISKTGGSRKELLSTSSVIEEMYVDSQGTLYYLAGGKVYERASGAEKSTVVIKGGVTHFIPTVHGVIAAKGSRGNYTLYAGGTRIRGGVNSFYTVDNYLILNAGGKDYQAKIRDLFEGFEASDIEPYTLGDEDLDALQAFASALMDDDECEECKENAAHALTHVTEADEMIGAVHDTPGVVSALDTASEGQKNMVKRARQQHEIKWTPVDDIYGWGGNYLFKAGTTYSGLPYGQPVYACYVPWDASLEEFAAAVANGSSKMYTSRSYYNRSAPYYSCDCSSFVSWSWDLSYRQYTRSIVDFCTKVETQSIYSVQIGDAFNKAGSHVVMVSDVGYRGDKIVYIDIMEQTPPSTKYTRWGEGGTKELEDLYDKYLGKGYTLYRSKTRETVSYTPCSVVPLSANEQASFPKPTVTAPAPSDGQDASFVGGEVAIGDRVVELNPAEEKVLSYTADETGTPVWTSSDSSVVTVSNGKVKAVSSGKAEITLTIGSTSDTATVYVKPAAVNINSLVASYKNNTVTVKWDAVKSATTYTLMRRTASGVWESVKETTATSYADSGLSENTTYYYTVRAASSLDGKSLVGKYDTTGKSVRTCLAAPALKTVSGEGNSAQTVVWDAVSGAEGYRVYSRLSTSSKWTTLGNTTSTSYTAGNLIAGKKYIYTVRAYFTVNGQPVLGSYDAVGVTSVQTLQAPALKKAVASKNGITVTWKKVAGAVSYTVYKKVSGGWKELSTVSTTKYLDKDVVLKKKYTYSVRANINGGASGPMSQKGIACYMRPAKVSLKSAVSSEEGKATITWKKVTGVDGYLVYMKTNGGKWKRVYDASATDTSFTKTGIVSGAKVTFTVKAYWKINGKTYYGAYKKAGTSAVVQ